MDNESCDQGKLQASDKKAEREQIETILPDTVYPKPPPVASMQVKSYDDSEDEGNSMDEEETSPPKHYAVDQGEKG